jgi:hypothetical protein
MRFPEKGHPFWLFKSPAITNFKAGTTENNKSPPLRWKNDTSSQLILFIGRLV